MHSFVLGALFFFADFFSCACGFGCCVVAPRSLSPAHRMRVCDIQDPTCRKSSLSYLLYIRNMYIYIILYLHNVLYIYIYISPSPVEVSLGRQMLRRAKLSSKQLREGKLEAAERS
jgi:hypothetical protein